MKIKSFAEAMKELESLKHARAVWMEIVEHLSKCLDREVKIAENNIFAEGCVADRVPQAVIKDFIRDINEGNIDPLNEKIDSIENLTVMENSDDNEKSESDNRSETSTKTNEGQKDGFVGKKIRAVAGSGGGKTS